MQVFLIEGEEMKLKNYFLGCSGGSRYSVVFRSNEVILADAVSSSMDNWSFNSFFIWNKFKDISESFLPIFLSDCNITLISCSQESKLLMLVRRDSSGSPGKLHEDFIYHLKALPGTRDSTLLLLSYF
jgi:hypothetical protein